MSDHDYLVVTTPRQWQSVAHHFEQSSWLGLDTEFMREKTYYPQLCLVQLSCEKMIVCLDPLAFDCSGILTKLLGNPAITKIVHSASQDIEVLGLYCKTAFERLYDTQLAAEFCGYASQMGYAGLVKAVLGLNLDKSETRTRWHKRPLTSKQIEYSLDDVRYLKPLYDELNRQLHGQQKSEWMDEEQHNELARMCDFRIDPKLAYLRFKLSNRADARDQEVIKTLANWREKKAQQVDKPKNWILTDKVINAIAAAAPADMAALKPIVFNSSRYSNAFMDEILACIRNTGKPMEHDSWSAMGRLEEAEKQQAQSLRRLVEDVASDIDIPVTRLATRQDIDEYVRSGKGRLADGWRSRLLAQYQN